jgi:hypothetical protein
MQDVVREPMAVLQADAADDDRQDFRVGAASAIFLHAGWRSCGTWLWETLRERAHVRAYYEPLHEDLDRLDRAALTRFSPGSWDSGHSPGAPYFAEYIPCLRRGANGDRAGIEGYDPRFAFDDFCLDPDADDPALHIYLQGLIDTAHAEGRMPVLKFCRSLGRVPWMVRQFPGAFHAVVLRDPIAQWLSARRQMEASKNRYFVLAPFIILARNAAHPLIADAVRRLVVPMPPHLSRDLGVTTQVCWHHVRRLNWAERYRGFLALWAVASVIALSASTTIIDSELLAGDARYRRDIERALGTASGNDLSLGKARAPSDGVSGPVWAGTEAEAEDARRAAFAALDFVTAHRDMLMAVTARLLVRKLTPRFLPPAPRAPLTPAKRSILSGAVAAAAYVVAARAIYPLQRLHFHARNSLRAAQGR